MRHALVPVHLIHSARSAAAGSARYGAEPKTDESYGRPARRSRRSRRLATRVRRTRAYTRPALHPPGAVPGPPVGGA